MGLMPQLPDVHWFHHLSAFFRRFMPQPPSYVPGLFSPLEYKVETRIWHDILRDDANACKLMRLEFCKTRGEKLHEFLILYFSHPTHTVARAVAIVDRAAKDRSGSQSSAIASPSIPFQKATEAYDRVQVMGQEDNLETYLSKACEKYDKLCTLEYTSAELGPSPPSAMQLSTLLVVVSNHQPNYNLYEHNCYWYADMIFEACKKLFPGYREDCVKHEDRGRCRLNIPVLATRTLPDICNEYNIEWQKVTQRGKESQEAVTRQELERALAEERRAREVAQQEVWKRERMLQDERREMEVAQQKWGGVLEEERRATRKAAQQLEEERRAREANEQELKRQLEESERRCQHLQAVRETPNAAANAHQS